MISDLADYWVSLIDSNRGTGEICEGIQFVQFGDHKITTQKQPAISVDWDDNIEPQELNNRQIELRCFLAFSVYVSSLKGLAATNRILQDHMMRWDATAGRWMGLVPMLLSQKNFNAAGHNWIVKVDPNFARVSLDSEKKTRSSLVGVARVEHRTRALIENFRPL